MFNCTGFFMDKILIFLLFFLLLPALSQGQVKKIFEQDSGTENVDGIPELKKSTTLILTVLLGPVGGHRVALGTKSWVPLVYTLTLGGGLGLVPLIDFFATLFSKDLENYRDQGRVLMWLNNKKREQSSP